MMTRPARLPQDVFRRGILALVVAAYYLTICWHPGWMNLFGVDHLGVWFLDTHALLAASDAHALGLDPADRNPLDFFHQPHVYSDWWFALRHLGLTRIDHVWLGAVLGFVFLGVALLQVAVETNKQLFLSFVALTSPSVVLGFNRGNADLLVFIVLAAVVPCLLSPRGWLRWASLAIVVFAAGLKFYPVLAGLVFLAPTRARRETLFQLGAFAALVAALAVNQWEDLRRYFAEDAVPDGIFTFGANMLVKTVGLPEWASTPFWLIVICAATIFWWRIAPSYQVPAERRADHLKFIIGATLLTGCYFLTVNYAYRRVFAILMVPFLGWAWGAPYYWPVWFRRLGRATGFLLVALMWLDGFVCLVINLFTNLSEEEALTITDQWMAAQQPFVAFVRIGLLAFLVPFVRDSLRALRPTAEPNALPSPVSDAG
jgi:hypothetical protein